MKTKRRKSTSGFYEKDYINTYLQLPYAETK